MKRIRWAFFMLAVAACLAGCRRGLSGMGGSGDRVLVAKFVYDTKLTDPRRFEVVVFKYPNEPVKNNVPTNYIKRLLGLPGEIIAIFFGNLYRWFPQPGEAPPHDDKHVNPLDLWRAGVGMHDNVDSDHKLFQEGRFEPIRKPPAVMLTMRRIVYDNDFPAKDLTGVLPPRWQGGAWQSIADNGFRHLGAKAESIDWLRYQNILRPKEGPPFLKAPRPELITDFIAYNTFDQQAIEQDAEFGIGPIWRQPQQQTPNWTGDLMVECKVTVDRPEGEFWMELSKGIHRYRACWQLDSGACTLYRVDYRKGDKETMIETGVAELATKPTKLKGAGTYLVRLANFDSRLTVWVDGDLPFGNGHDYPPPEVLSPTDKDRKLKWEDLAERRGPTANDLEPASLGSRGAACKILNLKLWRDTHYTRDPSGDATPPDDWSDPLAWGSLRKVDFRTLYVQPGHYLCLGDNSPSSSDSREWGLVPERLMLGRALMVYWPFNRIGPIR